MIHFRNSALVVLLALVNILECPSQEIPKARISNGIINCDIYLPDQEIGYYRGARFDWSGVIPNLEYQNHTYFGKWFKKYEPTNHDAIMGPVQVFDPIGYDQAKSGDEFVKIGVGILQRPDTSKYHFSKSYKIVNNGLWKVKTNKSKVKFTHKVTDGKYPYTYRKIVKLKGNKLIIEHILNNDGHNAIKTNVFNHNFFVIDKQITGPGLNIKFPFKIYGDKDRLKNFAKIVNGNQVKFLKELGENDHVMIKKLTGFGPSHLDYNIIVENTNTGAGVKITSDRPLSNFVLWGAAKTISPEPYIDIDVKGSESFSWITTYEFYTL